MNLSQSGCSQATDPEHKRVRTVLKVHASQDGSRQASGYIHLKGREDGSDGHLSQHLNIPQSRLQSSRSSLQDCSKPSCRVRLQKSPRYVFPCLLPGNFPPDGQHIQQHQDYLHAHRICQWYLYPGQLPARLSKVLKL